jgi:hypothetical protein
VALEKVGRNLRTESKGTIYKEIIQILVYADDIVLVWRTTDVLEAAIVYLSKTAK